MSYESRDPSETIWTPDEVATFLRTDTGTVRRLLESGTLAGFRVGGDWRVLALAVVEFMKREMKKEQDAAFARVLSDPRTWTKVFREIPGEAESYLQKDYPEGSFGAWIKNALRSEDAERARREHEDAADNVVPLDPRSEPPS